MPSLFARRRESVDAAAVGGASATQAGSAPIKQEISMSTTTTTGHGRKASTDSTASPSRGLFGIRRGSKDESASGTGGLAALKSKLAATGSRVNLPFGQHSNASFLSPTRNTERRGSVGSPASPTAAGRSSMSADRERDPQEAIRASGKRLSLVMHGEGDSPVGNENAKRRSAAGNAPPSAWRLADQTGSGTGSTSAAPSIPQQNLGLGGSLLDDDPLAQSWKSLEPTPVRAGAATLPFGGALAAAAPVVKEDRERTSDDVDSGYGGSMPPGSEGSNSGGIPTMSSQPHHHEQSPLHRELVSENTSPTPHVQPAARLSPQPTSPNPSRRPDLGTLAMPPALTSRQSMSGHGMTIVPSTPMPRPIANLPTLIAAASVSGSAGTSRAGPGSAQGPYTPVASLSRSGSQIGTPISQGGNRETKWARSGMPVMLREPSTRPAPPVEESDQEDSLSDSDSDADDDDLSESGTSGTDEASSEGHGSPLAIRGSPSPAVPAGAGIPRRGSSGDDGGYLGGVASRPLAPSKQAMRQPRRHRGSIGGSSNVEAIHEEREDEGEHPNMTTLSDRRPAAPNRLGPLPATGSSMSTATVRRASQQPAWSLPTPSTPPANSPFATFASSPAGPSGWTQFGAGTPIAKTPGGLGFSPKPAVKQFAKVKELGKTPSVASPSLPAKAGYFDIPSEQSKVAASADTSGPETVPAAAADPVTEVAPLAPASLEADDGPTPRPIQAGLPMPTIGDIGFTDAAEISLTTAAMAPSLAPALASTASALAVTASADVATPGALSVDVPTMTAPQPAMMQQLNDVPQTASDAQEPTVPTTAEDDITPAGRSAGDDHSRSVTPETPPTASSSALSGASTADLGAAVLAIPADPTSPAEVTAVATSSARRPGLYSQRSRSMIDLSSEHASGMSTPDSRVHASQGSSYIGSRDEEPRQDSRPRTPANVPDWLKPPPTPAAGFGGAANEYFSPIGSPLRGNGRPAGIIRQESRAGKAGSPLKRTRSLQETRSALPEYSPPEPGSKFPQPREEEGREGLPQYWCHVHIEGYLPRKMEFSSPGVQSRDRSWKRLYFVLHGTALSVYKHDVHKMPPKGPSAIVPAVNANDVENLHVHLPGERRSSTATTTIVTSGGSSGTRRLSDAQPARASSEPPTGAAAGQGDRRGSTDMSIQPAPANGARRASNASSMGPQDQDAKDAQLFPASVAASAQRARAASVASATASSNTNIGLNAKDIAVHLPFHSGNTLVKQYSLQNAESGLAADYVKKKNVVRVRAAGEQFLLQTESAKEVVDWIEAFQAATNVSLELDVRPMPKIITLPRRRRRRRPGDPPVPGQPATEDTPEGNARAVAAATAGERGNGRGASSGAVDAMERMLAEDQAAGG